MSSAQLTIIDTAEGADVELRVSDQNPESSAVVMATYLAENWDVVTEACRRHLVLRQAALDGNSLAEAVMARREEQTQLVESRPKILNADGTGTLLADTPV